MQPRCAAADSSRGCCPPAACRRPARAPAPPCRAAIALISLAWPTLAPRSYRRHRTLALSGLRLFLLALPFNFQRCASCGAGAGASTRRQAAGWPPRARAASRPLPALDTPTPPSPPSLPVTCWMRRCRSSWRPGGSAAWSTSPTSSPPATSTFCSSPAWAGACRCARTWRCRRAWSPSWPASACTRTAAARCAAGRRRRPRPPSANRLQCC